MNSNQLAVIIPVYNKFCLTSLCLDSIVKSTHNTTLQVFVVDNASEDDSYLPLIDLVKGINQIKGHEFIRLIRNEENLGFSGGVNCGLRVARSEHRFSHFCILNNDTVLSDHVFDDLVEHAVNAVTGGVSNSIGNEQVVPADYPVLGASGYTRENVRHFAKSWRPSHMGEVVPTKMLGFLCVVIPKNILDKVGLLDEEYGLGYYEDDDYCHRTRKAGYKLLIVRSAFIHHFGSASFSSLGKPVVNLLFEKNKKLFERKHGVSPSGYEESADRALFLEIFHISRKASNFEEAFSRLRPLLHKPPQTYLRHQLMNALKSKLNQSRIGSKIFRIARIVSGRERDFPAKVMKKARLKFAPKLKQVYSNLVLKKQLRQLGESAPRILFFCPILSFFNRNQRPQHLARNLADLGNLVIWIEPEFASVPPKSYFEKVNDKLIIFHSSKLRFDNFYVTSATKPQSDRFLADFEECLGAKTVAKAKWMIESPFWVEFAERFHERTIYDCMDYHAGFGSSTIEVDLIEDRLIKASNKILVTSQFLSDYITSRYSSAPAPALVRNACTPADFPHFSIPSGSRRKVGYFGAVAEWFDADLLMETARVCPEIDFEIIGNISFSKFERIKQLPPNLKLFGEKPYNELPVLCKEWSAALIPFLITDLIKATNPVKLYEYYAMGLPVISTEIPEVIICEQKASWGKDAESFSHAIRSEILGDSNIKRNERRNFALGQTWRSRAEAIERSL